MMKHKIAAYLKMTVLLLLVTVSLSSCEEDDWYGTMEAVRGRWSVVEVEPYGGQCPYHYGDVMVYYGDGSYEAYGSAGFEEYGYWGISHGRVAIDFDDDGRYDFYGAIVQLDGMYMVLDVRDASFGSRYVLRLVRM